jgi:haloalkane dehalogenase
MPSIDVLDSTIHYEISGDAPVVYLHGNPTSSHAWRHVLPRTGGVAPDLIGMGRSGKPDIAYSFADHARYLDAFVDRVGLDQVVLVGHDWGGALAFDWAARHPERVRGIAFFETILKPLSWADYPPVAQERFKGYRTAGVGERKILEENVFITEALNATTLTTLSDEDYAIYAAPYPTPETRRPLLAWPRATPIDGEPADVVARAEAYDAYLASDPVPKLLLTFVGSPTLMIKAELTAWCEANMAALEVVHCGAAGHLALEDQPGAIGDALVAWFSRTLAAPSRRSVPALGR